MKRFEHNAPTAFFLLPSCYTKIVPAIFVNVNVNVIDGCHLRTSTARNAAARFPGDIGTPHRVEHKEVEQLYPLERHGTIGLFCVPLLCGASSQCVQLPLQRDHRSGHSFSLSPLYVRTFFLLFRQRRSKAFLSFSLASMNLTFIHLKGHSYRISYRIYTIARIKRLLRRI